MMKAEWKRRRPQTRTEPVVAMPAPAIAHAGERWTIVARHAGVVVLRRCADGALRSVPASSLTREADHGPG